MAGPRPADFIACWDDPNRAGSGYDICTGTSMSSPYVAAVGGILRSINPLLSKAEIRESLTSNASLGHLSSPHAKLGFGVPDADASAEDVLGTVSGQVLGKRLTPLFELYSSTAGDNASRDDWAIFPESELSSWTSQGYSAQSGANPWIGYVYENVDTDGDHVIDGFENLIGTNPSASDSDCDGASDGAEILEYPYTDPEVGSC